MSLPYSVGFNGHAKVCDCGKCGLSRARALAVKAKRQAQEVPELKRGATIFVRAHFRKGKHLTKFPTTMRWYKRFLKEEFRS